MGKAGHRGRSIRTGFKVPRPSQLSSSPRLSRCTRIDALFPCSRQPAVRSNGRFRDAVTPGHSSVAAAHLRFTSRLLFTYQLAGETGVCCPLLVQPERALFLNCVSLASTSLGSSLGNRILTTFLEIATHSARSHSTRGKNRAEPC